VAAKERRDRRVHFDRVLCLLDPSLRRPALILEGDDALRRTRQIGDHEADTQLRLIGLPLTFATIFLPALRLVAQAGDVTANSRGGRPTGRLRRCPILFCEMILDGSGSWWPMRR